ncbi:HAD-like domain-containing protein [Truncatella angustata]|uniref:Mitochondrial import inner membrane translocase subunit TIM50 n=1 Tax=Truncatella angustata TaxID=152316 RepID=A0A9P8UMY5_9PEZI|nr:HAD-like domain-containing protein [Truncatella angustata]KAH6655062.1 HAD-like domain-containing protein [Truncatella angustata]
MLGNHPVFRQQAQSPTPLAAGTPPSRGVGHGARPLTQSNNNPDFDPDVDSDASSNPSVGEPLPQLTPHQIKTVTIPILGKSANKKAKLQTKKRPYIVPSKASGGVPNPSKNYIRQSALAPSRLDVPRNILVIIDLNGTLLHRPNHKKTKTFVERPFARNFLDYCLRTFTVGVWSSAKPDNVRGMMPQLLSPQEQAKLVTIWGRDTLGLSPADYNQRVQVYKRLESVWNDPKVAASHPEACDGKRWDQTNTVLIDDSKEKARSQPFNIILLPEFEGDVTEPGYVLPQVHDYLNECAHQRDISSFIRENPFRFDPAFLLEPKGAALADLNNTTNR